MRDHMMRIEFSPQTQLRLRFRSYTYTPATTYIHPTRALKDVRSCRAIIRAENSLLSQRFEVATVYAWRHGYFERGRQVGDSNVAAFALDNLPDFDLRVIRVVVAYADGAPFVDCAVFNWTRKIVAHPDYFGYV